MVAFPLSSLRSSSYRQWSSRHCSTKTLQPLNVMFCGSDDFSIASLRALDRERLADSKLIHSIEVICRPGKRTGRGLKTIREVPIKRAAMELGLNLHEIDTFTGWTPSFPIDLIVAVSFGLFVPPRILSVSKYGGLNVHPSLLPDFRGPAPLHHTLLKGRMRTGVTLQTLHPQRFDHGVRIAQTAFDIPEPSTCTVSGLLGVVAPKGADLLVQGIRERLFVPPLRDVGEENKSLEPDSHAPKITNEDRHIQWNVWTVDDILRRYRILGDLWGIATVVDKKSHQEAGTKRIILSSLRDATHEFDTLPSLPVGRLFARNSSRSLYARTGDGRIFAAAKAKVEGSSTADAAIAASKAHLFEHQGFWPPRHDIYTAFIKDLE